MQSFELAGVESEASPGKYLLEATIRASIQEQSREAYLEAISEWSYQWQLHRPVEQIAKSSLKSLNQVDLLHLAEEIVDSNTLAALSDDLLEQSRSILEWISIASTSGKQDDAIKVSTYIAGVFVPLMVSVGQQQGAIALIDLFVGESQRGFRNIFGLKHQGMTDEAFAEFEVTRTESKKYRYFMLAPLLMSTAAYFDPDQPGSENIERILESFSGHFVSPCTLLRIGLLAVLIGSTDRALIQRCVSGAKRVGAEQHAQLMIDYITRLN